MGDPIEVEVLKVNDGEGNVLLSRKTRREPEGVGRFTASAESEGKVLEGTCKEAIKGGVIVYPTNGASAFVPASQVSTKYVADLKEFVGKPMKIKVLEVDAKRRRIIGSAKAVLLAEAEAAKEAVWDSLTPGMKVMGTVRRIVDFGVCLLTSAALTACCMLRSALGGRIKSPAGLFTVNQKIEVVIREVDKGKQKDFPRLQRASAQALGNRRRKIPRRFIRRGQRSFVLFRSAHSYRWTHDRRSHPHFPGWHQARCKGRG